MPCIPGLPGSRRPSRGASGLAKRVWGERAGWLLLAAACSGFFFSTSVMFDILLCARALLGSSPWRQPGWQGKVAEPGIVGVALGLGIPGQRACSASPRLYRPLPW